MYFIGEDFKIEMISGKHVTIICPTNIEDVKKLLIKEEKVISIFNDDKMCDYVMNKILKIQQSDNVKIQKESSKFLKSNFLRVNDFLLVIKCEGPNCVGHMIFDPKNEENPFEITGRHDDVDCYIVTIK